MFVGKLTKLSDNINALRTNEVFGAFTEKPELGQSFVLTGESLEDKSPGMARRVWTSLVETIEIVDETEIVFKTLNSQYKLSEIKRVEGENVSSESN